MTTLLTIIKDGYRENQVAKVVDGAVSLSDLQLTEGLARLKGIIARNMLQYPDQDVWVGSLPKTQLGEHQRDFTSYAPNAALPQNVYVKLRLAAATTLYLPAEPGDGARIIFVDTAQNLATYNLTIDGNGNTIDGDTTATLADNGGTLDLFFRQDLGEWREVGALTENSLMPFPEKFDDMFAIELAMRIDPRYGRNMPEITAMLYKDMRKDFDARYRTRPSSASPDLFKRPPFGRTGVGVPGNTGSWMG